jgi:antibiotic biosynthesis monooxygenase (ABM) superfamily enzyme
MKSKLRIIAAVKIWLIIYPSITFFLLLFGEPIASLPLFIRTFILTIALVPWMVFIGLPVLDKIFQKISSMRNK